MITVKELIEILQGLDPNAYVVRPGHSDEYGSYDSINPNELRKLLTIQPYEERSWRGEFVKTRHKEPNGYWAYCV